MSCGSRQLYIDVCGIGGMSGQKTFYQGNESTETGSGHYTISHYESDSSQYLATFYRTVEADAWKPVPAYTSSVPSAVSASDFGFSYNPGFDLALSYVHQQKVAGGIQSPEQKQHWKQERDDLELLIAAQKKVLQHA